MGRLAYIDIETTGFDVKKDRIVSIQYRYLDDPIAPLVILKAWENPNGEHGVVKQFAEATGFFARKWETIMVGWNCQYDLRFLVNRGLKYGYLEPFQNPYEYEKPHIDLHHFALLANYGHRIPDDAMTRSIPGMFYDSALSNFSRKRGGGAQIAQLAEQGRFAAIDAYILQEWEAFWELWNVLIKEVPRFWERIVAPQVGRGAPGVKPSPVEGTEKPQALG